MRILFLGEYSNVHWTLAEGLRALGHEVTVISNGDFWKNYPRDIDLVRKPGFLGGIIYYIKALALLPKLRGYDIVQLINPMFLELKAERIFFFYDYLRRHNKKVFLCAFGMDYYWAYTNAHQKPLRYSDFNIGSERRTDPIAMADYNDWVGTGKERLNKYIAEDCDAIISGLYEYDVTYRTAGFGSKTIFIPFPIVPCENPCTTITEKLNLFIGISRSRSAYKGTDIMLRAAQRIAEKYPERVELTVAEGVPFNEYKQMLNKADVILDQLYAYTPAMNALEAMNRGTILVGGGEEEQYDIINEKELRPIINVLPTEESVYNELERLILHGNIQQLKHDSVEYIRHHHDYIKVAKEYERVYAALNSPLMGDALPLNSQVLDKEKSIDKTNLKSSPLRGGLRGALILLALMLSLTAFAQQGIAQIPQQTRHIKPLRLDEADMDISRQVLQTDKVTQGFNLPQAYTGEGVVLGVTDIGFDFTHPNFKGLNIVGFWDMLSRDTLNSYTPVFTGRDYSAEEFKNLQHSYDALEETHGTHVLGIAAGTSQTYRGIAPNADILLVNNVLSNNFEQVDSLQKPKLEGNYKLEEFQYMFDYAASKGQPCVINISAGTRQSFGDNFETNNHAISKLCGPGRIIVASAGNNGMQAITLHKRPEQESVGSWAYIGNHPTCYLFLQKQGDVKCNFFYSNNGGATKHALPDSVYEKRDTISDYDGSEVCYYIFQHERMERAGYWRLYVTLTGTGDGWLFTENAQYLNSGIDDGFNDASNEFGVNFPASYDDVICVGATNYRNELIDYQGVKQVSQNNGEIGRNYSPTSVGPRLDGYQKPDVCAPGSNVASSMNSFFLEQQGDKYDFWDKERFQTDGRTYAYGVMSGTSMSSPMVAGIIALWLQANPSLSPQDIKGIIQRTSKHPDTSLSYPNPIYGYGEIDAYAGLLDILGISNIEAISKNQPESVRFSVANGCLLLHFADTNAKAEVVIYTTSGQKLLSQHITTTSETAHISLRHLPKGVYAVQVNSASKALKGSTLIRL